MRGIAREKLFWGEIVSVSDLFKKKNHTAASKHELSAMEELQWELNEMQVSTD